MATLRTRYRVLARVPQELLMVGDSGLPFPSEIVVVLAQMHVQPFPKKKSLNVMRGCLNDFFFFFLRVVGEMHH